MRRLFISVTIASIICFATELKPLNIAPPGADIERFPIFRQGELTDHLADKSLGLRLHKLSAPLTVFNHYRGDGSWRLQILPEGDEVWVEKGSGTPRYRALCSNRIVLLGSPITSPKVSAPLTKSIVGDDNQLFLAGIIWATMAIILFVAWLVSLFLYQRQAPPSSTVVNVNNPQPPQQPPPVTQVQTEPPTPTTPA